MASTGQRMEIYQGETLTYPITVDEPDPDAPGKRRPHDLTGAAVLFSVRLDRFTLGVPLIFKSSPSSGIFITDVALGEFDLVIDSDDTKALEACDCAFDLWLERLVPTRRDFIAIGTFRIQQAVTRFL